MPTIPILILAAGASSRMRGQDKLLLTVDEQPLLRRTARVALATGQHVIAALPPEPHPRHDVLADLPIRRVPVEDAKEGMNASLRAGLLHLPQMIDGVMILLADLPELTVNDLKNVLQASDFSSTTLIVRGTTTSGKPGHPVVFARSLLPELKRLSGDAGAQEVVRRHGKCVRYVPLPGQHARRDLDTPEDWDDWRSTRRPS